MALKKDLQSYFAKSDNAKVKSRSQKGKPKDFYFIQSSSNITNETENQLVEHEIKKQVPKSHYKNSIKNKARSWKLCRNSWN